METVCQSSYKQPKYSKMQYIFSAIINNTLLVESMMEISKNLQEQYGDWQGNTVSERRI